jgi:hypothetical protein
VRRLDDLFLSRAVTRKYLTREDTATYDTTGAVDYMDDFNNAEDAFSKLLIAAGARIPGNLVDLSARAGYALIGQKPKTPREKASEYFMWDFTFAQTPEQTSFLASSWVCLACYPVTHCGHP